MIVIGKPAITIVEDFTRISSQFTVNGKSGFNGEESLWFEIPSKFSHFLEKENMDTFLIGLLFLGMKTGYNIHVEGSVSGKLCYSLNHYLINALCLANPAYKKMKITALGNNFTDFNTENIGGTAMSCGVDSFATYYDNYQEKPPYNTKFFTFHNVGSHGDFGGKRAREIFKERLQRVKDFSKSVGKEVISIDSNLSEILRMNFQQTHTLRNIAAVLCLQKLFKTYYYSSAYRFDHFILNSKDTSDSDILNLQMLSTESTTFYSGACQFTRLERMKNISDKNETFTTLDVCTSLSYKGEKINCTTCDKCLRTALSLDLIGRLEDYSKVFYLDKYESAKNKFVGKVIATKNSVPLHKEICELLEQQPDYRKYGIEILKYNLDSYKGRLKKALKKKLKP